MLLRNTHFLEMQTNSAEYILSKRIPSKGVDSFILKNPDFFGHSPLLIEPTKAPYSECWYRSLICYIVRSSKK